MAASEERSNEEDVEDQDQTNRAQVEPPEILPTWAKRNIRLYNHGFCETEEGKSEPLWTYRTGKTVRLLNGGIIRVAKPHGKVPAYFPPHAGWEGLEINALSRRATKGVTHEGDFVRVGFTAHLMFAFLHNREQILKEFNVDINDCKTSDPDVGWVYLIPRAVYERVVYVYAIRAVPSADDLVQTHQISGYFVPRHMLDLTDDDQLDTQSEDDDNQPHNNADKETSA